VPEATLLMGKMELDAFCVGWRSRSLAVMPVLQKHPHLDLYH
jgi:hypothetical protein